MKIAQKSRLDRRYGAPKHFQTFREDNTVNWNGLVEQIGKLTPAQRQTTVTVHNLLTEEVYPVDSFDLSSNFPWLDGVLDDMESHPILNIEQA